MMSDSQAGLPHPQPRCSGPPEHTREEAGSHNERSAGSTVSGLWWMTLWVRATSWFLLLCVERPTLPGPERSSPTVEECSAADRSVAKTQENDASTDVWREPRMRWNSFDSRLPEGKAHPLTPSATTGSKP